ncbi:MAG: hypothetical protein JJU36_12545 [Phycisphaeraceae bacterium]|nr:hypothetical protein [Phycisphaeraceae bacterium]
MAQPAVLGDSIPSSQSSRDWTWISRDEAAVLLELGGWNMVGVMRLALEQAMADRRTLWRFPWPDERLVPDENTIRTLRLARAGRRTIRVALPSTWSAWFASMDHDRVRFSLTDRDRKTMSIERECRQQVAARTPDPGGPPMLVTLWAMMYSGDRAIPVWRCGACDKPFVAPPELTAELSAAFKPRRAAAWLNQWIREVSSRLAGAGR